MCSAVIVDDFERYLFLKIRKQASSSTLTDVMSSIVVLKRTAWLLVSRQVELAMGDPFLERFPRDGTNYRHSTI